MARKSARRSRTTKQPGTRVRETSPAYAPDDTLWYVETSALLSAILEGDAAAVRVLRSDGRHITSALTVAEAHRAIVRARVSGRIGPEDERALVRAVATFARRCEIVAISEDVLARAGRPFPHEPVRTLDAIHLATLDWLSESPQLVTVLTRDTRVEANARALGYRVT